MTTIRFSLGPVQIIHYLVNPVRMKLFLQTYVAERAICNRSGINYL